MIDEDLTAYYSAIALPGKKLTRFDEDENRHGRHNLQERQFSAMNVCTFNERRFMKRMKAEGPKLLDFHRKYLSRIFPAGTRLMSSNYSPSPYWAIGCQMVALNYQGVDASQLMNLGKFTENGSSGYVLKPKILADKRFNPFCPRVDVLRENGEHGMDIELSVIAAQQLPPIRSSRFDTNPYVTVSIHGIPKDYQTKKTSVVNSNGLNPRWINETFR